MSPVVKALLLTLLAVCGTYTVSVGSRLLTNSAIDTLTLINCGLIPTIITLPIALYVFRQGERLKMAHEALNDAHQLLNERASRDSLTGLLNRESFLVPVELTRRGTDRGVLLIADADHFKSINDNCGHLTGDAALKSIAKAISGAVRGEDLVGRLGGEEFGVFLKGADLIEARAAAERIRQAVENLQFRSDVCGLIPLTVSIGGTVCQTGAPTAESLEAADQCLYDAKRSGRNRVVIGNTLTVAAA